MAEVRKHNAWKVLGALMVLSMAVGVGAYGRFIASDKILRADLDAMALRGRDLAADQCVAATLSWSAGCQAMKSLCDATTPLIAHRCLDARDRTAHCAALGKKIHDTHFGYKECEALNVTRKNRKVCAGAYRAMADHCAKLQGEANLR